MSAEKLAADARVNTYLMCHHRMEEIIFCGCATLDLMGHLSLQSQYGCSIIATGVIVQLTEENHFFSPFVSKAGHNARKKAVISLIFCILFNQMRHPFEYRFLYRSIEKLGHTLWNHLDEFCYPAVGHDPLTPHKGSRCA